mmetsp:Transcript_110513/g.252992  ORF Transcript_110513/g.252992 Transcript_110513/m.252992 type:complete len:209 (-) Transcript_110513:588-1214(-)
MAGKTLQACKAKTTAQTSSPPPPSPSRAVRSRRGLSNSTKWAKPGQPVIPACVASACATASAAFTEMAGWPGAGAAPSPRIYLARGARFKGPQPGATRPARLECSKLTTPMMTWSFMPAANVANDKPKSAWSSALRNWCNQWARTCSLIQLCTKATSAKAVSIRSANGSCITASTTACGPRPPCRALALRIPAVPDCAASGAALIRIQ